MGWNAFAMAKDPDFYAGNYTLTSCRCCFAAVCGFLNIPAQSKFGWSEGRWSNFLLAEPIFGSTS